MDDCLLCTVSQKCPQSSFVLFPTTPIVKDILIRALWDAQIAHRAKDSLITIEASVEEQQLSVALKERLHDLEMRDIRITRARGPEMLNAPSVLDWLNQSDTTWFDEALANDQFKTFFQPIVSRHTSSVFGHECLVRLQRERVYNGGEIISAAVSRGRIHAFDSYVRQLSVRTAARMHVPGTKVFINFMPSSIYDPVFCMKSTLETLNRTKLKPEDVVFEVVESEAVSDRKHLQKICAYYRERGFGFALDDVGTGANSLQMVCDLQPDYIKVDKSLISGIDQPMYRATIGKIVELATQFGLRVIAEGVETGETADACSAVGIQLMQGYYFARPAATMVTPTTSLVNLNSQLDRAVKAKETQSKAARTKKPLLAS